MSVLTRGSQYRVRKVIYLFTYAFIQFCASTLTIHYTVLYHTISYYATLHCTTLSHSTPHYTIPYHIALSFQVEASMLYQAHTKGYLAASPSKRKVANQAPMQVIPLVMEPKVKSCNREGRRGKERREQGRSQILPFSSDPFIICTRTHPSYLSSGSVYRIATLIPSKQSKKYFLFLFHICFFFDSQSRFYSDPVVVLDFQSLYPSMIIAYNLCFSTIIGKVIPGVANDAGGEETVSSDTTGAPLC